MILIQQSLLPHFLLPLRFMILISIQIELLIFRMKNLLIVDDKEDQRVAGYLVSNLLFGTAKKRVPRNAIYPELMSFSLHQAQAALAKGQRNNPDLIQG